MDYVFYEDKTQFLTKLITHDSPCTVDHDAEVQLEQTSRVDPGHPSERRAGLVSLLQPAGRHSGFPLLFHTCGTTAAHKSLCLEVCENSKKVNLA